MAKRGISVGQALGEGFRLVGRRPVTVWVWGLVLLLPGLVPLAGLAGFRSVVMPGFEPAGPDPFDPQMFQVLAGLMALNGLSQILQIVGMAVVMTAVARAVLGRVGRRPFALGLGLHEVRVGVSHLVVMIGLVLVLFCLGFGLVAGGLALMGQVTEAQRPWGIAAVAFLILAPALALYGRLSLIAPASVAYGRFAFEEGWRMGRGQTGRLALLTLGTWLATVLVVLAAVVLMLGVGFVASMTAQALPMDWRGADWALALGVLAGIVIAFGAMAGVVASISLAPYACAVRQLFVASEPAPSADGDIL